jgi:[ribosomal protein S5]-alanine N-acetyltransferase
MPNLSTMRLLLRPLQHIDAATIAREINHFEIARNLARVPFPYELKHAEEFIAWQATLDSNSAVFAVEELARPDQLIGVVSHEWSDAKQNSELGYWYAKHAWGKGYASEAAAAAVRHAFEVANRAVLISCYHNDNPASGRVLEKVGFEATQQCNHFSVAQNRDVPVTNMTLTKERWSHMKKTAG